MLILSCTVKQLHSKDIEWQYAPGVVQFTGSNRLKSDYIANKIGPDYDPARGVDFYWRSLILGNRENETTETVNGGSCWCKKIHR